MVVNFFTYVDIFLYCKWVADFSFYTSFEIKIVVFILSKSNLEGESLEAILYSNRKILNLIVPPYKGKYLGPYMGASYMHARGQRLIESLSHSHGCHHSSKLKHETHTKYLGKSNFNIFFSYFLLLVVIFSSGKY